MKSNKQPSCPDVCPITNRPFFMWIEHRKTGQKVPTYGGPFDSYTIPVRNADGEFACEHYDHDAGSWAEGTEIVGLRLIDDQHEDFEHGTLEAVRDHRDRLITAATLVRTTLDRDGDEWGLCSTLSAAISETTPGAAGSPAKATQATASR